LIVLDAYPVTRHHRGAAVAIATSMVPTPPFQQGSK